jgi:hypothetical protein
MAERLKGRGPLNALEQLPRECDPIVAWANEQLRDRKLTQQDIYEEFFSRLQALQREHHGELEFAIPSLSAFNRYSIKLAALSRRLDETRDIANQLAKSFDAQSSDNLTILAAEAIKTLVFELATAGGEAGFEPKEAKAMADALRSATQAQQVSSGLKDRRDDKFKKQAAAAVDKVAKAKGLTTDTAEKIKAMILGIGPPPPKASPG